MEILTPTAEINIDGLSFENMKEHLKELVHAENWSAAIFITSKKQSQYITDIYLYIMYKIFLGVFLA